jgi:hypothetical protein
MNTNTNRLLAAVLALQALTLAGQWSGRAGSSEARADLPPDPAAMRLAQTEELKGLNQKLDRLVSLLEGGRLDVRVSNFAEMKNMNKDNGNGNGNAKK